MHINNNTSKKKKNYIIIILDINNCMLFFFYKNVSLFDEGKQQSQPLQSFHPKNPKQKYNNIYNVQCNLIY